MVKKRRRAAVIAQIFSQTVTIVVQVGAVAVFVAAWGVQLYGEWLILYAVPAYLAMSDAGLAAAASNEMIMDVARGDRSRAVQTFQTAWVSVALISLAVGLLLVGATAVLPAPSILNFSTLSHLDCIVIVAALAVQVAGALHMNVLWGAFACEGRHPLWIAMTAGASLSEFACACTVVLFGGGPTEAAIALAGGRLVATAAARLALHCRAPWLGWGASAASTSVVRRLARPALASAAFPVGNALNVQGMVIVIGAFLGPVSAAAFSTIRTLTRFVIQPLRAVFVVLSPEVATAFAKGESKTLRTLHRRAVQASIALILSLALALFVLRNPIMDIWTSGHLEMDTRLFLILLSVVAFNAAWYTSLVILYSTNRHGRVARLYLLANLAVIPVAGLAATTGRIEAPATALVLAEAIMCLYVLPVTLRAVEDSPMAFIRGLLQVPGMGGVSEALKSSRNKHFPPPPAPRDEH